MRSSPDPARLVELADAYRALIDEVAQGGSASHPLLLTAAAATEMLMDVEPESYQFATGDSYLGDPEGVTEPQSTLLAA